MNTTGLHTQTTLLPWHCLFWSNPTFKPNWLEHHFFEQTQTCSSFGNRTWTPYFWLQTIEHQTSNIVQPITTYSTSLINIKSFQNMHVETVFSVIDLFFTQKIKNVMSSIKMCRTWNTYQFCLLFLDKNILLWYNKVQSHVSYCRQSRLSTS